MAPSKSPVFAVCGGISVETVVAGTGRRRSSIKARRSAPAGGLAESLYADLLWDCGGANVEKEVAPRVSSPTETDADQDFTDVFGGPPKFATLSINRGMSKGLDACFNGVSIFQSFVSAAPPISFTSAYGNQPRLCSSKEAPENLAPLSNSAKLSKPRLTTEAEFSSRICYSDSDEKVFIHHKEEAVFRGDEFFTMMPQGRTEGNTSSATTRREPSRSDRGEDNKDSRGLKPSRKDFVMMKENIQEPSMTLAGDLEEQLDSVNARMSSSSSIGFQEASMETACFRQNLKAGRRRDLVKIKRKGKPDELWVTIKEVHFATEPSRFPPPSRPPPSPKRHSDAAYVVRSIYEPAKNVDDSPERSFRTSQNDTLSDSGSLRSVCTQQSCAKMTSDSKDVKDAMEMAEAKIRMVLEAREKAKLMVEKKLREKQRARQHKARIATEGKRGKEHNCKEHRRDLRGEKEKLNARCCEGDADKQDEEGLRKRDLARQCIERATREVQSKSAAAVQEKAAELRASQDIFSIPVEHATEDSLANTAIDSMAAEATPKWSDTNADLPKRFFHKAVPAKMADEENISTSREHQQDSSSSSWCFTEWKRFCEAASLEKVGSMPRTYEDSNLFFGGSSCLSDFQEIVGEPLERRKARWDRHCQTAERMAKALEEKKQRDVELQKEQAERHRAGEMLDEEIKGWAAGKEGNLEALLCSLHYVLWPECGWDRVSSADLTSAAAVKKAYRRATLCVHPDKVQQKGATVAQKYTAEKIFDLLKEASANSI